MESDRLHEALDSLIRNRRFATGGFGAFARDLVEVTADAVGAERVSVWDFLDGEAPRISCRDLWVRTERRHANGIELGEADCASYLAALREDRVLVMNDAASDPRCVELARKYLPSGGITSMLDCPFHFEGDVAGVLCIEHVGTPREWTSEERSFGVSVASMLSIALEAERRRQAEACLQQSEARYRRAAQLARLGHWIWDEIENRCSYCSPELAEIYGVSVDEYLERSSSIESDLLWFHPEDRDRYAKVIRTAVENKAGYEIVARIIRGDGEVRWLHELTDVVLGEDGTLLQTVGVLQDITEAKRIETDLTNAKEAAESANRAKSEFIAHMSHELRTPLNAILGMAEIMEHRTFGDLGHAKYGEYASDIVGAAKQLLGMITDILDLSRIESTARDLRDDAIDIHDAAEETIAFQRDGIGSNGPAIVNDVPRDLPRLRGDTRMFRQVLANILANAVKFTPEAGTVTLAAELDGAGGLSVRIADTGCGIASCDIEAVLEPFGQARAGSRIAHRGIGLGLSLARKYVDAHGGELIIDSEVGTGTTVTCRFPPERTIAA